MFKFCNPPPSQNILPSHEPKRCCKIQEIHLCVLSTDTVQ